MALVVDVSNLPPAVREAHEVLAAAPSYEREEHSLSPAQRLVFLERALRDPVTREPINSRYVRAYRCMFHLERDGQDFVLREERSSHTSRFGSAGTIDRENPHWDDRLLRKFSAAAAEEALYQSFGASLYEIARILSEAAAAIGVKDPSKAVIELGHERCRIELRSQEEDFCFRISDDSSMANFHQVTVDKHGRLSGMQAAYFDSAIGAAVLERRDPWPEEAIPKLEAIFHCGTRHLVEMSASLSAAGVSRRLGSESNN